jgi:hypothetical protein
LVLRLKVCHNSSSFVPLGHICASGFWLRDSSFLKSVVLKRSPHLLLVLELRETLLMVTSARQSVTTSQPLAFTTVDITFAGDHVMLSGQMDYPAAPPPQDGYPLVFILHHAGPEGLEHYWHYARLALTSGCAVFRWDKRGTGHSGAGGRGSTTQDAVNAYEIALEQPRINRRSAVILAQDAGTGLLGDSYGLFARVQRPFGVALVSNMLDEKAVLALEAPVCIVMAEHDWNPWETFGRAACDAHSRAYRHGAQYHVVPGADRRLLLGKGDLQTFHPLAEQTLQNWLRQLCQSSR